MSQSEQDSMYDSTLSLKMKVFLKSKLDPNSVLNFMYEASLAMLYGKCIWLRIYNNIIHNVCINMACYIRNR